MSKKKEIVSEVVDTTVENLGEPTPAKAVDSFVFMDDVKRLLDLTLTAGKNVILHGPGGYGKSEFTQAFLFDAGITPFVQTMGTGMTTDRLFGGLNIPVFNATGKVEYLIENSFMANEYVVFEELFDAPDFILEQLKDILSSGIFRNGGQIYPIKTKSIICCTNRTREEFSKNASLKALMERFPLEMKVVWKDHNKITYEKLFVTKFGSSDPLLPYLCEEYAKAGLTISPRIAVVAAEILRVAGPDALNFVADFGVKPQLLKDSIAKFKSILEISKKVEIMNQITKRLNELSCLTTLEDVKEATSLNKKLATKITELKAIKADDSMVSTTTEAIKNFNNFQIAMKNKLAAAIAMEDVDMFADTNPTATDSSTSF
jgi:hypothetical protein